MLLRGPRQGISVLAMSLSISQPEARRRASAALSAMAAVGVDAKVFGSLARGQFRAGSDIDFLVLRCPRAWKYRIESVVEDILRGVPFDVIYQDETPPAKLSLMLAEAVGPGDLR